MSQDECTYSTSVPFNCSNTVPNIPYPRCRTIDSAPISTTTSGAAAAPSASNLCTTSASSNIYASADATTTTFASIATVCSVPKTILTVYPAEHQPTLLHVGHGQTDSSLRAATSTLQMEAAATVHDYEKTTDRPDCNPSAEPTSRPNKTDPYSDTTHINSDGFFRSLWYYVRLWDIHWWLPLSPVVCRYKL